MESTQVRVEYIYDPESRNWCFRVPSLGIIGGAETRDAAATAVIAAIRFTLEGDDKAMSIGCGAGAQLPLSRG